MMNNHAFNVSDWTKDQKSSLLNKLISQGYTFKVDYYQEQDLEECNYIYINHYQDISLYYNEVYEAINLSSQYGMTFAGIDKEYSLEEFEEYVKNLVDRDDPHGVILSNYLNSWRKSV